MSYQIMESLFTPAAGRFGIEANKATQVTASHIHDVMELTLKDKTRPTTDDDQLTLVDDEEGLPGPKGTPLQDQRSRHKAVVNTQTPQSRLLGNQGDRIFGPHPPSYLDPLATTAGGYSSHVSQPPYTAYRDGYTQAQGHWHQQSISVPYPTGVSASSQVQGPWHLPSTAAPFYTQNEGYNHIHSSLYQPQVMMPYTHDPAYHPFQPQDYESMRHNAVTPSRLHAFYPLHFDQFSGNDSPYRTTVDQTPYQQNTSPYVLMPPVQPRIYYLSICTGLKFPNFRRMTKAYKPLNLTHLVSGSDPWTQEQFEHYKQVEKWQDPGTFDLQLTYAPWHDVPYMMFSNERRPPTHRGNPICTWLDDCHTLGPQEIPVHTISEDPSPVTPEREMQQLRLDGPTPVEPRNAPRPGSPAQEVRGDTNQPMLPDPQSVRPRRYSSFELRKLLDDGISLLVRASMGYRAYDGRIVNIRSSPPTPEPSITARLRQELSGRCIRPCRKQQA